MPLYCFECVNCGNRFDIFAKIDERPESVICDDCGEHAVNVIIAGHGGIKCDSANDIPWFASAIENLQPDHERPLETRGEYNKYLKDKNIIASG